MKGRTTGCAVAGIAIIVALVFLGRHVLRQTPTEPTTAQTEPAKPEPLRRARPASHPAELPAEAPVSQPEELAATNAATLYRQAFALYDALSKDEKRLLGDWRTNVDASVEAELCEKVRPICDLMHRASSVTNCDWGLGSLFKRDEMNKRLLPVLQSSRSLARLALWSSAHCRAGDASQAVIDLVATERLGHSMPPLLIGHLVNLAIQGLTEDFIARHASTFAFSNDQQLAQLLEDEQFDEGYLRALEGESDFSAEPLTTISDETKRALAEMIPRTQSMDDKQLIECIRQIREWQVEYLKALQLPEPKYQEWLARLHEAEKTNPLLESFITGSASAVAKTQCATIRNAMVAAGLAVARDGEDALRTHPDPSTGQPFIYTETIDGFELQSGYQNTNLPPLKMQFR